MSQAPDHHSLSELSARFELELRGDGACKISGVGTLSAAGPGDVSFLANAAYRPQLESTTAGAVILHEQHADDCPVNCLVAKDPYLAYARIAELFDPRPVPSPGIHPSATVDESAVLGENVSIGAQAVIGPRCEIGAASAVGPGTVLEEKVTLGQGCRIHANVTLEYGVRLGDRVIVHPGSVIGSDGFGIAFATDRWQKVPQLGSVRIGNDCEIGANCTIDRGAIEDTVLEDDVRFDNQVHIAHNVYIGAHTAMAGRSGIAGSSRVGRYCLMGGHAGIAGHIEVADKTTIAANSIVFQSITEPGTTWSAQIQAQPLREWQRNAVRLKKLDQLATRLQQIEKQMRERTPK